MSEEIKGNIVLNMYKNVNIMLEAGVNKVYLPNGKELEIPDPVELHLYNCNGVLVLKITHFYKGTVMTKAREWVIGNFVLLTYRDIKIEDCEKSDKK